MVWLINVKKLTLFLLATVVIMSSIIFYGFKMENVEYKVLTMDDLPEMIQEKVQMRRMKSKGFHFYYDKEYTYVFYKTDHRANEYINTNLIVKRKNGNYTVTAIIGLAANDDSVSYEKIIKFKKIPRKKIMMIEKDKR